MIAIICLFFPALLLVLIRERKFQNHSSLYDSFLSYCLFVVLLNGIMVLILRNFFHNYGQLFAKLNSYFKFAGKYFALSIVLAIIEPYIEKYLKKIFIKAKAALISLPKTAKMENVYSLLKQSLFLRVICTIELLVLICIVLQCLRPTCNSCFSADELVSNVSEKYDINLLKNENASYYQISSEEVIDDTKVLTSDTFKLYPGAYNVKIMYVSDTASDEGSSFANSTGTLTLSSDHHGVYFNFNSLSLRDSYTEESQTVQINAPVALDDLKLSVSFKGGGSLEIYNIEITEIIVYKYVILVIMLLLFLLLDAIIINFLKGVFAMTEGILCLICLAAIIPFAANFSYSGHDINFHLNRIVCLSDELKLGNYFPAIFTTALNGYGYANPLFYGQFFLYIPAILYSCGFSLTFAYNAYIVIFSVATCLIMYFSSLQIFKKNCPALLAAALYTLSAVRLTNIFTRCAVGEFTAQTFLPLVVLGFYNIYSEDNNEKITMKKYIPIVIGLTGIFLSHMLTTLMCVLVIVGFCVLNLRKTLEQNRMLALCKAAVLTILVNLSAIVPFVDSYSMELAVNNKTNYIQASGVYLVQLFNVIVDNFQVGSASNTAANEMSLTIGFSITLGLIIYAYYFIKKKDDKKDHRYKFSRICFIITCVTLFLATKYMPYDSLDFLPETIYSLLTVYQFSWRWLVFSTLFGVYCTAYGVDSIDEVAVKKYTPVVAFFAVIAILGINTGQIYADQLRTSTLDRYSNNSYSYNMSIGSGEYVLYEEGATASDTSKYNYATSIYDESAIVISNYQHDGTTITFYAQSSSEKSESVALPIICYDNYYAYDENGIGIEISKGKNNRISINVPAGYNGEIKVIYHFRYRWRAAIFVSVITIVLIVGYSVYEATRKKSLAEEEKKKKQP